MAYIGAEESNSNAVPSRYLANPMGPITLKYKLQRGFFSGEGQLDWRPQGPKYSLSMTGLLAGLRLLEQKSIGTIDHHGLSPQQFFDQRARNPAQTATLLSSEKRIIYSDAQDAPWMPGTQDRLSWMIQLPAIIHNLPEPSKPGERIILYITGARGDADIWRFQFVAIETISTPLGPIMSHKWVREARRDFDSKVQVWLDPQRNHLPVRAELASTDGTRIELLLSHIH